MVGDLAWCSSTPSLSHVSPSGMGDCHGPAHLTGPTQHFRRRVVQRGQGVTFLLLRHLRPLCGRQVRRHLLIDSLRWTWSLGRIQNHFRWKKTTAHAVLEKSCHCASPKEAPAAIAASELTQTSIPYIMHLCNSLDFICIGVPKSPEMTVTIPDVAPCSSIKRAVVYFLNSQTWLHDARYSNYAATTFFFFLSDWDRDRLRELQEWHIESVFIELKYATSGHLLALKRHKLCLGVFQSHLSHGRLV